MIDNLKHGSEIELGATYSAAVTAVVCEDRSSFRMPEIFRVTQFGNPWGLALDEIVIVEG